MSKLKLDPGLKPDLVWFGLVWFGLVWFGLIWFGYFIPCKNLFWFIIQWLNVTD